MNPISIIWLVFILNNGQSYAVPYSRLDWNFEFQIEIDRLKFYQEDLPCMF